MFSTLTTMNGYNPVKALFLKEFWDNKRAIFITPMVITGFFIFFALIALINGKGMSIDGATINERLAQALQHNDKASNILTGIVMFSPVILKISVGFSMVFTALSVLFDERKDKSILFWKSMPVSDTQEVLVKLATVTIVTPLVAIGFVLIIQTFITLLMGAMVALNSDFGAWEIVFSNIDYLAVFVHDFVSFFIFILWTLPIFTWFMLVSSFSRRSPFLLAFIVPVLIIVGETIFFRSSIVQNAIVSRFMYLAKYTDRFNIEDGKMMEKATSIIGSLSEPALWIGIIAAAIMIVGCVQIRKRNNIT